MILTKILKLFLGIKTTATRLRHASLSENIKIIS